MKKLKGKVIGILFFIWFFIGHLLQFTHLIKLTNDNLDMTIVHKYFTIFIIYSLLGSLLVIIWIYYNKKMSLLSWSDFLKSEIDLLDEDERGLELDAKAKTYAMNWLFALLVIIVPSLFSFCYNYIPVSTFLITTGISFTVYEVAYYLKLKRLYHDY